MLNLDIFWTCVGVWLSGTLFFIPFFIAMRWPNKDMEQPEYVLGSLFWPLVLVFGALVFGPVTIFESIITPAEMGRRIRRRYDRHQTKKAEVKQRVDQFLSRKDFYETGGL
jgi:hypothetical protein